MFVYLLAILAVGKQELFYFDVRLLVRGPLVQFLVDRVL